MQTTKNPFSYLFRYSSDIKRKIYLASSFSVLNKLFDIAPEILIGVAVDLVVAKENSWLASLGFIELKTQLIVLGILTLIIWGSESCFQFLQQLNWREIAQYLQHKLRIDAYSHVQNLKLKWFEDRDSGNTLSILNDDVNQIERFVNDGINELIQVVVSTLVIGLIFFLISPKIALVAFCPIPLILLGTVFFQKKLGELYLSVRSATGKLNTRIANNLSGIITIKSFRAEDLELKNLLNDSLNYQLANKKAIKYSSAFVPVIRMGVLSGFVVTLVWGGALVLNGEIKVGSYSVLIFLTQRLLWPLTRLGQTVDNYQRSKASAKRVIDLIEQTEVEKDLLNKSQKELNSLKGDISFKNVTYNYNSNVKALDNISLNIKGNSFIGIVGGSGSGKSTLIKLILKFITPSKGEITLSNTPLEELDRKFVREKIGFVSQEVFLFSGTIKDNIAYATKNVLEEEIIEAAKSAEADSFIKELPDLYNTEVGERGQKLSGGQKQRLSIARAILKNPDILILDEATSSVDNETEAAIQKSLEKLSKGRTTIVIAHRLSTITKADKIFVLKNGELENQGTHQELLLTSNFYKKLWDIQTGKA